MRACKETGAKYTNRTISRQCVAPVVGPRNRVEKLLGTISVRLALARQLVARASTASQDTASSDGWPAVLRCALPPGKRSPDSVRHRVPAIGEALGQRLPQGSKTIHAVIAITKRVKLR